MFSEALRDVSYYLLSLWPLSFWSRTYSDRKAPDSSLRRQISRTRAMLRRYPRWHEGHFQLGLAELRLLLAQNERPSPRSIGAVRVSAEVVLMLMSHRSSRRKLNARYVFEARTLLAMSYFLQKRYADARTEFSSVLAYNNRSFLRPALRNLALEYGGLTAFLAERYEEAFEYLTAVPPDQLSKEALTALDRSSREQSTS